MRLAVAASLAAVLAACAPRPGSSSGASTTASGQPVPGVVPAPVAQRLVEEGARVVDVRTPQEFAAGHVPGAVNIPFDQLGARASELGDPSQPVVLYCRWGRRSGIAAETLRGLGFGKVYDFQRYSDWPDAAQ